MMKRALRIAQLALTLLLVGCSSLAPLLATPTPVPAPQATSTPETIPTSTATTANQPRLLRVWLPPRFDPNAETPAAELFKRRLLEFEDEYPGIHIEVRIKSEADVLNALSITDNAAPASMPDLVALSHADMRAAVSTGLLHSFDGLTTLPQDPDWYAFARDLGKLQDIEYGIPFAGDLLLAVYRPAVFEEPPSAWETLIESNVPVAFPAADPKALFSLSLYLSEDAQTLNNQGGVALDEESLLRLFSFQKQAIEAGTFPRSIVDHQTDEQSLQLYRAGGADLAIVWASSDLPTPGGRYAPLPGLNNLPYSLGDGWVWALAGSDTENQPLAVELASYLVESSYMSEWTRAAGYLPTRPQALAGWDDEDLKNSIGEALRSAHPVPSEESLSAVGPLLQEALIRLYNGEQPEAVTRSVIESAK